MRVLRNPWLPVVGWMALIFWFSSQPDLPHAPDELMDFFVKKGFHALEYGILAVLAWRALRHQGWSERASLRAWVLSALYAASDELHQAFVPGRTARPFDVAVDWLGAGLALLVVVYLVKQRRGASQASDMSCDTTADR
jgi:VanZ family protein